MRLVYIFLSLLSAAVMQAQPSFQLAAPFIVYSTIFFNKELSVAMAFEQTGAQIRYTADGTVPHAKSRLYRQPLTIHRTVTVKARSFARGFKASETTEVSFIKSGRPATVIFPRPDDAYPGTGPHTLTDNEGGMADHRNASWLGYNTDSVEMILHVHDQQPVRKILFNVLQNQGAWIFYPSKAVVYAQDSASGKNWQLLNTITIPAAKDTDVRCKAFSIGLGKQKAGQLKLVLFNTLLPAWHPGAGKHSWMFIDEIKVY